ncbi:MAG: hypothetical protein NC453_20700, partial [Muribaculum sp.]|nr:hypothetical protein [Muribaculum sp.]
MMNNRVITGWIATAIFILVSLHTANAEIRRNNDGLKLVKALKVTLLSSSGELGWPSLRGHFINFEGHWGGFRGG